MDSFMQQRFITPLALALLALIFNSATLAQEPETEELTTELESTTAAQAVVANDDREKDYLTDTYAYIADEFLVPLRSTPCGRCTIVHRGLKSGTKLQLLEIVDGWGHLITDKGTEGWLEEQFISREPIARIQVVQQAKKLASLTASNAELRNTIKELRDSSKTIRGKLNQFDGDKASLQRELAEIKTISADAIAINQQNEQLVKNNLMLQRENDTLKANVDDLQKDHRNQSFLYGGLTVFLGAILVVLIPKLRGRKRFSEWS